MPVTVSPALAAWVLRFRAEAGREDAVESFVAFVNDRILAELPVLAADPVLMADLHASTKTQYQIFLSLLEREKQELLLPPQAADLALSIARRQLELNVLLKVYRVAAAAVWEYFATVASSVPDDGPDRTDVLVYLWDHGGTWINEAIEQLIAVYYAEREATMQGAIARRTETVHALLRGDVLGAETASRDLGYHVRSHHLAAVLWHEDGRRGDPQVLLAATASRLAERLAAPVLSFAAGRAELWCWFGSPSAWDHPRISSGLGGADVDDGIRLGVGRPAPGPDGFRTSHREAVAAQRHALALVSPPPVTDYRDVELACLVAGEPDGVRAMIRRELGGLDDDGRGLDRVRETLAAFLRFGGNVDQTAAELIVHKNTIRYRLSQVEELVGHPLTERRTELALALACRDRYRT